MALDCFALLGEPRRPWIDPDVLRTKFQRLSADAHPDRLHGTGEARHAEATRHYAELNSAYQLLRDPKERLGHLLELELGHKPTGIERVPDELMELFTQIGQLSQDLKRFLAGRARITSPLLKVEWFEQSLARLEQANGLLAALQARRTRLTERLERMNGPWAAAPPPGHAHRAATLPMAELEEIFRTLSYLNRWTSQLQEQSIQLIA